MKIDQDVLAELSAVTISPGGQVRIVRKLDRKLYVRVNKVLEALGGKWSRKAQAHLFPVDTAQAGIEAALLTGEVTTARDIGYFPTPMPLARELAKLLAFDHGGGGPTRGPAREHPLSNARHDVACPLVLEPSAGDGNLVAALRERGLLVVAVEREARLAQTLRDRFPVVEGDLPMVEIVEGDFLVHAPADPWPCFDGVLMNPPFVRERAAVVTSPTVYVDHLDHVLRAFKLLTPGGTLVSVLPVSVQWRLDKKHVSFREWVADYGGEITPLPDDSFAESGTHVRTCVLRMRADG